MDNPKKEDDEMQFGPQGKLGWGFWLFLVYFVMLFLTFPMEMTRSEK